MKTELFKGEGVVIRVGELYLKGGNRDLFMNALVANVKRSLADRKDVSVHSAMGRIFVHGASDSDILFRLKWVFGISSFSRVIFCKKDIEAVKKAAVEMALQFAGDRETVFRISPKRSDKSFSINSRHIAIETGRAVASATGYGVDLEQPDLTIGIEVGKSWCFLFTERITGGGGLPVGTSGRAALLLSGGIDSPVAGHLLQKRGVELICIYFHAFPHTSEGARNKVIDLARLLSKRQKELKLYSVQFARIQETLRAGPDPAYLVLLYRRAMLRIAEKIADRHRTYALASGENLGQVASQTMENMAVVENAVTLPVLRPLLTMDKAETIEIARNIGTYDISIEPFDDCCTLFVPQNPETKGHIKKAQKLEKISDCTQLEEEAAETAETTILR